MDDEIKKLETTEVNLNKLMQFIGELYIEKRLMNESINQLQTKMQDLEKKE